MSLSLSQRHRSESWRRPGRSFPTLLLLPRSWSGHQIPWEKPGDAKATRRAPLTPITGQTSPRCPPGCRNCSPASSPHSQGSQPGSAAGSGLPAVPFTPKFQWNRGKLNTPLTVPLGTSQADPTEPGFHLALGRDRGIVPGAVAARILGVKSLDSAPSQPRRALGAAFSLPASHEFPHRSGSETRSSPEGARRGPAGVSRWHCPARRLLPSASG